MTLLRPLLRYADFSGRASRTEYWLFMTAQGVVYIACLFLAVAPLASGGNPTSAVMGLIFWLGVILLLMLGLALPNYALLARRLHDGGFSAFWMALILPSIASNFATVNAMGSLLRGGGAAGLEAGGAGALEQMVVQQATGPGVLAIVAGLCSLGLFVLTLWPGKRGTNRFGPDPKDPDARAPEPDGFDGDRWDAIIAEAKRGGRSDDTPYTPVFDFGPGPSPEPLRAMAPRPADRIDAQTGASTWGGPPVPAQRCFGRRGS